MRDIRLCLKCPHFQYNDLHKSYMCGYLGDEEFLVKEIGGVKIHQPNFSYRKREVPEECDFSLEHEVLGSTFKSWWASVVFKLTDNKDRRKKYNPYSASYVTTTSTTDWSANSSQNYSVSYWVNKQGKMVSNETVTRNGSNDYSLRIENGTITCKPLTQAEKEEADG